MDIITKTLQDLGLSETEAIVYVAGRRRGSAVASVLAQDAGIKRTTVYHALRTLQEKGLVTSTTLDDQVDSFSFLSPETLTHYIEREQAELEQKKKSIDKIIPFLGKLEDKAEYVSLARQFQGEAGVKAAIDEALYCKNKQWDIIAPGNNILHKLGDEYARYFLETRVKRKIIARSLWEKDTTRRKLNPVEIAARNPRFLPEHMQGKFRSMAIMYDDSILFISSAKKPKAVIIQSQEYNSIMSLLFEGLWEISQPYLKK
jgi:sugar-specific transcriptional regulator TrmB